MNNSMTSVWFLMESHSFQVPWK